MAGPISLSGDGRDLWERQPRESEKLYGYFCAYRDAGRTRTLKKLSQGQGITHRSAQEYSFRYRWTERCSAWDSHLDAQFRALIHEAQKSMARKHLRVSNLLYEKALAAVEAIDPQALSATETVRILDAFSKLQRFALGEPDSTIAVQGGHGPSVQIASVPADEAQRTQQLRAAMEELARRAGAGEDLEGLLENTALPG